MSADWHVLVPVKRLPFAKSRLQVSDADRVALALAMLDDVLAVALATTSVAHVHVVSADAQVLEHARAAGAGSFTSDEHDGLNGDLRSCLASLQQAAARPAVAIVVADLPCLTSPDLQTLLAAAPPRGAGFVAGVDGGTTMLIARDLVHLDPQFGAHSAIHHGRGAVDLTDVAPIAARVDVDTIQALRAAARIGLGPRTARLLQHGMPTVAAS